MDQPPIFGLGDQNEHGLAIGSQDDQSYFGLDDVSVWPTQPGIGSLKISGSSLVLNGLNGLSGGTYYVLTGTNLLQPLSKWTPLRPMS